MSNLKNLNLSDNKIEIVVDSNFKGLSELETLILSGNSISSFVSASFEHLTNLRHLDLARNRATKVNSWIKSKIHCIKS